jgi:hypothetical protein
MAWWVWLLAWLVLSTAAALWLGAAAAIARGRERAGRSVLLDTEVLEHRIWRNVAGWSEQAAAEVSPRSVPTPRPR